MAETDSNSPNGTGIDFGPMPTGTTTTKSPIGVPVGYKAPVRPTFPPYEGLHPGPGLPGTLYGTTPNPNQYNQGDQWTVPLSDPQSIPELQQELIQAGLLNPKSVRLGTWDVASANAYSTVLGFANAYGLNARQALDVLVSNPKANQGPAQPTIAFTNPQDVETGFQNTSQSLVGQEMPTEPFVSHYRGLEEAQAHQSGENYTQAPSVQGAAQQYLQEHNKDDMQNYGTASRMNAFFDLVRQG